MNSSLEKKEEKIKRSIKQFKAFLVYSLGFVSLKSSNFSLILTYFVVYRNLWNIWLHRTAQTCRRDPEDLLEYILQ